MAATPAPVVTLSAPYGAGGSLIGPRLAQRLGVPFLDRAVPSAVAAALASQEDAAEPAPSRLTRILSSLAPLPAPFAAVTNPDVISDEGTYRQRVEQVIRAAVDEKGGVVLGRAGALVLAGSGALHARLYGDPERRILNAMAIEGVDETEARRRMLQTDRTRVSYLQRLYGRSPDDSSLYDLQIDSTRLTVDAAVDLLELAAHAVTGSGREVTP